MLNKYIAKIKLLFNKENIKEKQHLLNETLIAMCYTRNIENIKKAVEDGANVNCVNSFGETPLLMVIYYSYNESNLLEIVKYLIEKGAKVNFISQNGNTALVIAKKYNFTEIIKFLQLNNK